VTVNYARPSAHIRAHVERLLEDKRTLLKDGQCYADKVTDLINRAGGVSEDAFRLMVAAGQDKVLHKVEKNTYGGDMSHLTAKIKREIIDDIVDQCQCTCRGDKIEGKW